MSITLSVLYHEYMNIISTMAFSLIGVAADCRSQICLHSVISSTLSFFMLTKKNYLSSCSWINFSSSLPCKNINSCIYVFFFLSSLVEYLTMKCSGPKPLKGNFDSRNNDEYKVWILQWQEIREFCICKTILPFVQRIHRTGLEACTVLRDQQHYI